MAKSKKGPALFELLGIGGDADPSTAQIPRWWSAGKPRTNLHESRAARSGPTLTLVSDVRTAGDPEPVFEVDGNRVRFSFTSVSAAIAIFAVLAVVTAGYLVGSRTGDRAGYKRGLDVARTVEPTTPGDEIQLARTQPPAAHLLTPLTGQPAGTNLASKAAKPEATAPMAAQTARPVPASGWVRDLTYIVIQEFAANTGEKAKAAQQFLAQKGVDAAIVTVAGGGLHLITTQGYNHKDAAQKRTADQLLAKVRTIGGQYYAAGGGYKLEGYYKTLKKENW